MEQKNNLSDITYLPELTQHPENKLKNNYYLGAELIRALTYVALPAGRQGLHKLSAH